jgi:hypothetical protein
VTVKAPELRRQLLAMAEEDQAARGAWIEATDRNDPKLGERITAADRKSTAALHAAIATWGWPHEEIVGEDGAHAAWLLAQHADLDVPLQKQPLVGQGLVSPADYAYLYDRVAVNEQRPQRYGTQLDGAEPRPIEDAAHVDERRRAVGLGTMAEYREQMREVYGDELRR